MRHVRVSLTENWLIFITRANGPFWSSIPSWQLAGAIAVVDIIATLFCIFGWFVVSITQSLDVVLSALLTTSQHSDEPGGNRTSIVAVVRIWIFSFGVFCVMVCQLAPLLRCVLHV